MEMECVAAEEDTRRLTQLRFDAAVKVIKSLPPDGELRRQPPCNTAPSLISSRPSQNSGVQLATVAHGQVQQSSVSAWLGSGSGLQGLIPLLYLH